MIPSVRTTSSGSTIARRLAVAAAGASLLVLGPIGAATAFGATSAASSSAGPQCQLFSPLEGGIEQFEQAWNSQAGSQGAPEFSGQTDIAQQMANGSGCPISSSSGAPGGLPSSPPSGAPGGVPSGPPSGFPPAPPSSGGGSGSSGGPQCQLFDPVTGGLQKVEDAWNTNSGQYTFTGSNDIAAAIDAGAGCTGTKPLTAPPSGGSSGGSGSSSSGGPQCQLFTPVEAGIEQVEQQIDANSGGQNPFAGSNDIAQQIANGSGCPITSSSGGSGSGSGSNTSGGGNTGSSTTQGGSSGGTTSPSSSSSGGTDSGGGATTAADSGSGSGSSGGSGALAFTGEPSWIPLAGVLLMILAGLSGLLAFGLRLVARQQA